MSVTSIEVVIDLENVQPPFAEDRARRRIFLLLSGIQTYLQGEGYTVARVWGCSKPRCPPRTREVIDEVFAEFGAVMLWTKQVIADIEIRQELLRRWQRGDLSPAVLLISNDSDFSEVLTDLRGAGIEVLVSGNSVGGLLRQSASRVIALKDMT